LHVVVAAPALEARQENLDRKARLLQQGHEEDPQQRMHSVLSLTTRANTGVCSAADFSRRPAELARIFYNVVLGQLL
jgi:hypothetical protein